MCVPELDSPDSRGPAREGPGPGLAGRARQPVWSPQGLCRPRSPGPQTGKRRREARACSCKNKGPRHPHLESAHKSRGKKITEEGKPPLKHRKRYSTLFRKEMLSKLHPDTLFHPPNWKNAKVGARPLLARPGSRQSCTRPGGLQTGPTDPRGRQLGWYLSKLQTRTP